MKMPEPASQAGWLFPLTMDAICLDDGHDETAAIRAAGWADGERPTIEPVPFAEASGAGLICRVCGRLLADVATQRCA